MKRIPWQDQIANGRVFELRSKSTKYPAPCALIIDQAEKRRNGRMCVGVDGFGVIGDGLYQRRHNPAIYVPSLRFDQFTSARVVRRRQDLERFDADDLALIRYGYALDFDGRIHGSHSDISIPIAVPASWTLFWLRAWADGDDRWMSIWRIQDRLRRLLRGAWYTEGHGGSARLGYKYGRAWATRHKGKELDAIREFLRLKLPGIIEQPVSIRQRREGGSVITEEIRRDCPALGSRHSYTQREDGNSTISVW